MVVDAYYYINDPGCDRVPVSYVTTEEEEKVIKELVKDAIINDDYCVEGNTLECIGNMCDNLEEKLAQTVLEEIREYFMEDDCIAECFGHVEMDVDELNDLVHSGDSYAIEYFGLEDLTEEELEEWDANDLDEIPEICDFDENFEPGDPLDYMSYSVGFDDISLDDESFLIDLLGEAEYNKAVAERDRRLNA